MSGSLWAIFGLISAVLTAVMMLMQEKMKVEPFALSLWCKIACVLTLFPAVLYYGLPREPMFYLWIAPTAVLYCVADVIFFRHLPQLGAGVVSRLLPLTVAAGFILWFFFDTAMLDAYMAQPVIAGFIVLALGAAVFFAMRLRKCTQSMQGFRVLWFVLLANTVAPLMTKAATGYAPGLQGAIGYTFIQAFMMITLWFGWLLVAKPMPLKSLLQKHAWQPGLAIGAVMAAGVTIYVLSVSFVDNPGYVSAIRLVNTVLILGAHRLMKKKDDSDVASGLGIVASAAAIIILKEQLGP